jgi:uncharacterized OsmC-like protein
MNLWGTLLSAIMVEYVLDPKTQELDRKNLTCNTFQDMIYEIAIESPASEGEIMEITGEAKLMCYAHNTLKKSVQIRTSLTLNGKRLEF